MIWMAFALFGLAQADTTLVGIDGMICEVNCVANVEKSIASLQGVSSVKASLAEKAVCIKSMAAMSSDSVQAVLAPHDQYTITSFEAVQDCPDAFVKPKTAKGPWDERSEGVDVKVISHGERVDLKSHLVDSRYTIFDFGAAWCGPCHVAAEMLHVALRNETDLAVRAIELGADPGASFDMPVAQQHLKYAAGLPHFVVYSPKGRIIYQGSEVDKLLTKIHKNRR